MPFVGDAGTPDRVDRRGAGVGTLIFRFNLVRIFVASRPVDFRKGRGGLAAMLQSEPRKDPFMGTVFVFRSKRADQAKVLFWKGTGLVLV